MAMMFRKVFVSTLVAVGLWGSLLGMATAQETGAAVLVVPRFGPGVAGNVTVGPITPVCPPDVPCDRPFVGASVQVIDLSRHVKEVVGTAVTNTGATFLSACPLGPTWSRSKRGSSPTVTRGKSRWIRRYLPLSRWTVTRGCARTLTNSVVPQEAS